ncbi:MAG: hypothetical protein E7289_01310 [Lachnospiraceae bacterium]|nr:hypothetical protein [Lachnospiraceae bacterium]
MTDNYVELLVKRKTSPMLKALRFACMVMGVLQLVLAALSAAPFFIVTGILFLAVAYVVGYFGNIEYEYLYVDRQLTIDKIHNQRKRKKVAEYQLDKDMEVLAPYGSAHLDYFNDKVARTRNYTSGKTDADQYVMVVHVEEELEMIRLDMNEEMLKQISMVSPRKVFKD